MVALREYVLSVSAAAILCGILCCVCGEKSGSAPVLRMLCGLIVVLAAVRPLVTLRVDQLAYGLDILREDAALQAQEGVDYASQAMAQLIKEKTAAYILDKAAGFGVMLQVEVEVTQDQIPIPVGLTITGPVSAYVREQLKTYIEMDLGIPRENQRWIN